MALRKDIAWGEYGDHARYSAHLSSDGDGVFTLSLSDTAQSPGDPPDVVMDRHELALLVAVLDNALRES